MQVDVSEGKLVSMPGANLSSGVTASDGGRTLTILLWYPAHQLSWSGWALVLSNCF